MNKGPGWPKYSSESGDDYGSSCESRAKVLSERQADTGYSQYLSHCCRLKQLVCLL